MRQMEEFNTKIIRNTMTTLPSVYLARHGETAWSLTGQHTGLTDLPLTERGERNARRLGEQAGRTGFRESLHQSVCSAPFAPVELAGFGAAAESRRQTGRMELRRLRRPPNSGNSRRTSRLAIIPRWLPRRGITGTGGRAG